MNILELKNKLIKNQEDREKQIKSETVYCPYCGAEMIKRKNKFKEGYWYGCSEFPNCRGSIQESRLKPKFFKKPAWSV